MYTSFVVKFDSLLFKIWQISIHNTYNKTISTVTKLISDGNGKIMTGLKYKKLRHANR